MKNPLKKIKQLDKKSWEYKFQNVWGPHGTMDSVLASHSVASGLIPGIPEKISPQKLLMLPRFIDGAAA